MKLTSQRVKFAIVASAIVVAAVFVVSNPSRSRSAPPADLHEQPAPPASPESLVADFDKTIQQRFLTTPSFGMARLVFVPVRPSIKPSHFNEFHANTDAEVAAVSAFEKEGWDVGVYLFGRRVLPRTKTEKANDYDIRYRMFNPIPVTRELKRGSFRKQRKLSEEAKRAFLEFQNPESANRDQIKFEIGDWSYIARPVRASSQSCLSCHTDYVITDKIADGKFTARPRRIGDVNGVLFYALRKRDEILKSSR